MTETQSNRWPAAIIALALVFLARAMFLNRLRTGMILTGFFGAYAVLICYEFVSLVNRL